MGAGASSDKKSGSPVKGKGKGNGGRGSASNDPQESVRLRSLFDRFDTDGSGFIDGSELEEFFRGADPHWTDAMTARAMASLDTDNDARVSFDELVRFWGSDDDYDSDANEHDNSNNNNNSGNNNNSNNNNSNNNSCNDDDGVINTASTSQDGLLRKKFATRKDMEIAMLKHEITRRNGIVKGLEDRVASLEDELEEARMKIAALSEGITATTPSGDDDNDENESNNNDILDVTIVAASADEEFAVKLRDVACKNNGFEGKINPILNLRGSLTRDEYARRRCDEVLECRAAIFVFSPEFFSSPRCIAEMKIIARRIERGARDPTHPPPGLFLCNSKPANMPKHIAYTLGGDSGQRIMFFSETGTFAEHVSALVDPLAAFLSSNGKNGGTNGTANTGGSSADAAAVMKPKAVFNSYAVRTKEIVWPAWEELNSRSGPLLNNIWIDKVGILAGGNWDEQISLALFNSRCAILWLSKAFFDSQNCRKEALLLARRIERGECVKIFPVFLDNSEIPVKLRFALAEAADPLHLAHDLDTLEECAGNDGIEGNDEDKGGGEDRKKTAILTAISGKLDKLNSMVSTWLDADTRRSDAVERITREDVSKFVPYARLIHSKGCGSVVTMDCTADSVVSGSWDGTIAMWNPDTMEKIAVAKPPICGIRVRTVASFGTASGRTLLAVGWGGAGGASYNKIAIYDITDKIVEWTVLEPVSLFDAHEIGTMSLAFCGGYLYSGGLDSGLAVWKGSGIGGTSDAADDDKKPMQLQWTKVKETTVPDTPGKPTGVCAIAVTDNFVFASCWASDPALSEIRVLDIDDLHVLKQLRIHSPYCRSLTVDPKTGNVFSTGKDGTACEIVTSEGDDLFTVAHTFRGHTAGVQSVMVGDGVMGNFLVTCGNDSRVNIFDVNTKEICVTLHNTVNGKGYFANACVLCQGRAFVASGDGSLMVFGPATEKKLY